MSDLTSSSGANTNASGESDKVAYETHQKLLREKKAVQEKLIEMQSLVDKFNSEAKAKEEEELKQKEDYKKLLELKEQQALEYKTKFEQTNAQIMEGMKLNQFLKNLSGRIDESYFPLIDTSSIPIDPNTNMPDQLAVQKAAKEFEQKYSKIIERTSGARLPDGAAQNGNVASLAAFQGAKSAKEKREMLAAVYAQTKNKEI